MVRNEKPNVHLVVVGFECALDGATSFKLTSLDFVWLYRHRIILPNVQDEPRPWLARLVLLGARDVTAMVVGSGALLGRLRFASITEKHFRRSHPILP